MRSNISLDFEADRNLPCGVFCELLSEILGFYMLFTGCFPAFDGIQYADENGKTSSVLAAASEDSKCRMSGLPYGNQNRDDAMLLCHPENGDFQNIAGYLSLRERIRAANDLFISAASAPALQWSVRFLLLAESFLPIPALLHERGELSVHVDRLPAAFKMLMAMYGQPIFPLELEAHRLSLADRLAGVAEGAKTLTRAGGEDFSEREFEVYCRKLQLLYRHIVLSLLAVDYDRYSGRLRALVEELDTGRDTVKNFLTALNLDNKDI